LGKSVERSRAAGGAHDAISSAILATQILDHGFKHAYVIVYSKQDGPRHMESVVPETGLMIELLFFTIARGPALLPDPTLARRSAWLFMRADVPVPI
jgi:hypothetical protein